MKSNRKLVISLIIIIIVIVIGLILLEIYKYNSSSKTLELTYKTSDGIPYRWEYEIEDNSIIKLDKSYNTRKNNRVKGGIVYNKYVFKGLKKGVTSVTFKYIDFNSGEIQKEEIVSIKVDKYKNISLVFDTN